MPEGFFLFLFFTSYFDLSDLSLQGSLSTAVSPEVVLCQINLIQVQSAEGPATAH